MGWERNLSRYPLYYTDAQYSPKEKALKRQPGSIKDLCFHSAVLLCDPRQVFLPLNLKGR